jgi:hypothetical protein
MCVRRGVDKEPSKRALVLHGLERACCSMKKTMR